MEDKVGFNQTINVDVIRKNSDYLQNPTTCIYCGNKRYWVVRCETCGHTEQKIV